MIDVGVDCYWREGTDGVSFNELCRRADVSKPAVYREFGGEDGLMDAALTRYADTVLAPVVAWTTEERPFAEVLDSMVDFAVDPEPGTPAGCLLAKMRVLSTRLGPLTRQRVDDLRAGARAAYADWVKRAQANGELRVDLAPDMVAAFLDAQLTSLLVQGGLGEKPDDLRAQASLTFSGLLAAEPPTTPETE